MLSLALFNFTGFPVTKGLRIEEGKASLSRAGGVNEDAVEVIPEADFASILAVELGDFDSEPLKVRFEFIETVLDRFDGHDFAPIFHLLSHEGGLSTRRGTEVEHPFSRFRIEKLNGQDTGGVLEIELSLSAETALGQGLLFFERKLKGVGAPRKGPWVKSKVLEFMIGGLGCNLERVNPNGGDLRSGKSCQDLFKERARQNTP